MAALDRVCWRALLAPVILACLGPTAQAAEIRPLVETCAGCHGEAGVSQAEAIPSLAGQPEYFVLDQLILMREGVREVEAMTEVVADLTDAQIEALAKHYAGLEPAPAGPAPDQALVETGAALAKSNRCASCHGPDLGGKEAIPRIAGQRIDYLVPALTAYRDGTRRAADTTMTATVRGLSDAELEALAHWAAAQ